MKLTFALVGLLAIMATVTCQEETTTVLPVTAVSAAEEVKEVSTEIPTPDESAPVESSTDAVKAEESSSEAPVTTEAPVMSEVAKEGEEKKEEPTTDEEKTVEMKVEVDGEPGTDRQPKEQEEPEEEEAAGAGPMGPPRALSPKMVFITQHIRDPMTGVIYTRQVPRPLLPPIYQRPPVFHQGEPMPPPMQAAPQRPQQPEAPSAPSPFDPLGSFNEQQKKRQFFQDMLHTQLDRFEKEMGPVLEREENITTKNDLEEIFGAIHDLKTKLDVHQIFNITELMVNWKEGKLADGQEAEQQPPSPFEQPRPQPQPPMYRPRPRPSGPPLTLRTIVLVPQHRHQPQQHPQQQPQYAPYPSMGRPYPVMHLGGPQQRYQTVYREAPQQQLQGPLYGKPTENGDAQPGENEYSNNNELFGY